MANTISTAQNVSGSILANGPGVVESTRQAAVQSAAKAAVQVAPSPRTDQASLSNVGALVAQASAGSDVRADKVASLSAAIASGTYNVPSAAVASKIVDSLLG